MTLRSLSYIPLLLLIGCSNPEFVTIDATCEQSDSDGVVSIKWEIFPPLEGEVKIYLDDQYRNNEAAKPIVVAQIAKEAVSFKKTDNSVQPKYRLVFNDHYSVITANRFVEVGGVPNFRDIGGCRTVGGSHIKHGMIYRSASLDRIDHKGVEALKGLGVKTIVDFRAAVETLSSMNGIEGISRFAIPVSFGDINPLLSKVLKCEASQQDVVCYSVELHRHFVRHDYLAFATLFTIMEDSTRYPILLTCDFGKDRTGFAVAHIMQMLGVAHESIVEEFITMTDCKELVRCYSYSDDTISVEMQEALTILSQVRREHVEAAYKEMLIVAHTVEQYQQNYFLLNDKRNAFFRSILLE